MDREPSLAEDKPRFLRRNSSGAISRRSAELARKTEYYPPRSSQSTPKKINKQLDLSVTGKQIKKNDRANSSPGLYARRMSVDATIGSAKSTSRRFDLKKFNSKSFMENDVMRLDLSQITNEEPRRLPETPKSTRRPGTSGSRSNIAQEKRKVPHNTYRSDYSPRTSGFDGTLESTVSTSRDISYQTPSGGSPYRYATSTDLDYSSFSPEYSGLSSVEISPKSSQRASGAVTTPFSAASQATDSSCYVSWIDSNMAQRKLQDGDGEWNSFWENYNNSLSKTPILNYYDQCPTPFRDEELHNSESDYASEKALILSPAAPENIQSSIQNDGLQLTAKETQNLIKCTHILSRVLSNAIERNSHGKALNNTHTTGSTAKLTEIKDGGSNEIILNKKEKLGLTAEQLKEYEEKKKCFCLELKEQFKPEENKVMDTKNTVTTQTDISLPNTKSAPKIFEKILRQLSRNSIDEASVKDGIEKMKIEDS